MQQPNTSKSQTAAHSPRVTLGLPVYNGEKYIGQTLDSILMQTFQDFELIISDNGSTDKTVALVEAYAKCDARIKLVQNERNFGATYNYRRVLALAQGEYFKWIAADDLIRPEFLACCVDILDLDQEVVLVYTNAAFIDEQDRVIFRFSDVIQLQPWARPLLARTFQMLHALFTDGSVANVIVFGLARTAALRAIRPLGNYFGCDYIIVTELALLGPIYAIPEILAFYRRHAGSSSSYNRRSAAGQQYFLDPSVTGRLRQELQLRRRYYELLTTVLRGQLTLFQRVALFLLYPVLLLGRAGWRIGYELRKALGRPRVIHLAEKEKWQGLHWTQLS